MTEKEYTEVAIDELSPDEAFELALNSISDALDWVKDIKPKENAVAILELLQQTLDLLDFYHQEKEVELFECNFNDDMTVN